MLRYCKELGSSLLSSVAPKEYAICVHAEVMQEKDARWEKSFSSGAALAFYSDAMQGIARRTFTIPQT